METSRGPLTGGHNGTIRHYPCQHCGKDNEILWKGYVPAASYNAVADLVREVGDEVVLVPVAALSEIREELERLRARWS